MNKKYITAVTLLILIVLTASGWGFLVHKTIVQLSIYELPKPMQAFFFSNKDSLVYGAPRPDIRRNIDKSEGSKHYMDMEYFGDSAFTVVPHRFEDAVRKYSLDTLNKYGTLPYVVVENLDKLTQAFRAKNADSIVFYAADLGHYVADAHVPLHTSINYDGQLTGQVGIHDLWETSVPELEITHYQLNSRHTAKYIADPTQKIWKIIEHSFSLLPNMLEKEKEVSKNFNNDTKYRWEVRWGKNRRFYTADFAKQYSQALGSSINDQLIAASDALADFWYTAWVNAGKPQLNDLLTQSYQKRVFKTERKAFLKNKLMAKKILIATEKTNND